MKNKFFKFSENYAELDKYQHLNRKCLTKKIFCDRMP